METNKEDFTPVITVTMREMLMNCQDRELLRLRPRLDYDMSTSGKLVDLGFFEPKAIVDRGGKTGMVFFVAKEGSDYLAGLQKRVAPALNNVLENYLSTDN